MLLDIPTELALEVMKVWLGETLMKHISTLDIAFCSSTQRPGFLDLISDSHGSNAIPLDRYHATSPSSHPTVPKRFVSYLG